jgi:glycosyltransferase involved in cell wall biosynthesis
MRIAHVSDVYLPRVGGVELQVHDLATRQRLRGDEAFILTTTAPGDGAVGAVPVLRLGAGRIGAGPHRRVPGHELMAALHTCAAQLVHVHISIFSPLAWAAVRLAAAADLPTVVSVHSMWHDTLPLLRRYARWHRAAQWPVLWTAVSTAAAQAVSTALDGTPVAVLPNGIDPRDWQNPSPPPASSVPTLISVMRMVRRKRPLTLLDMLLALQARHPGQFRAVLVGDGPSLPRLRRRADTSDSGHCIRLTGALSRPEIRRVLSCGYLYVSPAPRESFGIAALEARTAGLPVLARADSGTADFIRPGVEGWLAESDEDLASTITRLLADPSRLTAVARHNRRTTPPMQWPAVLDAAQALYAAASDKRALPFPASVVGTAR